MCGAEEKCGERRGAEQIERGCADQTLFIGVDVEKETVLNGDKVKEKW